MRLLHLSDLHFGYDADETAKGQRELLLNSLLERVELRDVEVVMVTGDVAWQCREEGYREAGEWFRKLKAKIKDGAKLIGCCGNHDVDHAECTELQYINDTEKIKSTLKLEKLPQLSRRFQRYIAFCEENQFEKLMLKEQQNYLVGSADLGQLRFWVLNSAWYALNGGAQDQTHLWMGRNFFALLDLENQKKSTPALLH